MTAEVDVRREACESDVNVGVIGTGNGINKDDGDGSYVFVTGSDAVASSDEYDLANGHCGGAVEANGGGELVGEVEESVVVVENPKPELQSHSPEKEAAAEESARSGDDPEIAAENSRVGSVEDQQSAKEDLVQESESTSQVDAELDKQVVSDPESKENGDGVTACDGNDTASASTAEQNGTSETGRSVAAYSGEVEIHLEKQVANGIVSDESGDGLPAQDVQESLSESLVTNHLVDITEKNDGPCEENDQIVAANCDIKESVSELAAEEENNGAFEQTGQILTANGDVNERVLEPIGMCEENGQILAANVDVQESVSEPIAETIDGSCEENGQILAANVDVQEGVSEPIAEKINGSCEENGQILAANVDVQESVSEPIAEKIDGTYEENGQILAANVDAQESVSEPVAEKIDSTCEENGQILAANVDVQEGVSEPIAKKINGSCEENGQILAANLDVQESVSEPIAENGNGSCEENGQSSAHSAEVQRQLETEVVNDLAADKSGDELLTIHAHEKSISEPLKANHLADTHEENGSCENEAPLEVQKQLDTPVINGPISDQSGDDLPIVHPHQENISEPDLVDTHEENGSSEKASTCENAHVENGESFATVVADSDTIVSVENENSLPMEDDSTRTIGDGTPEQLDEKNSEKLSSCHYEHSAPEVEAESAPIKAETSSSFAANDSISEPNIKSDIEVEMNSKSDIEAEIASVTEDALSSGQANSEVSEANSKSELEAESVSGCQAGDSVLVSNLTSEIESGHVSVGDDTLSSCPANDVTSEPISISECESKIPPVTDDTLSSLPAEDAIQEPKTSNDSTGCENLVSNDIVKVVDAGLSNLEAECADNNGKPTIQINDSVKDEAILPASSGADESSIISDDKPKSEEFSIITDDKPESEVAPVDSLEGQDKVVDVERRPFYYLIRIPRNDDEKLKEQIKHAQLQVEERTKDRDAIRSKMQMQRATCKEHKLKFEAAISEERAAQELLKSKRREMDSVQFMISKVKDALSVDEIANTIRHLEHTMAHETLPLKEEKQYIRDIKQLKQRRDQLSYSLGKQDDVQQSVDQKDQIEESIKDLKKEMEQLKDNLLKAQGVTQAAKRKYNEENDMLHELQHQFEAADATRQESYVHLQSLRKQNYEKTKHFWRYRNDAKAANDLALSGEKEQLQHICINQVESFMELWNTNGDFRKEYIKCNTRSTLRRLRTMDGRQLGPDEEPPVIPDIVRVTRHAMAPAVSTPEPVKRVVIVESEEPKDKSVMEIVKQSKETAKNKPVKVASSGISQATVSGRIEIVEEIEEAKPTKQEVELARKKEELRKEEEAARLREHRRQEEKAKAKEAMERKKRIAEKAQARAAIKAQKEAEEKEKEREKRARKKERKKASATKATNGINEGDSTPEPSSETTTATLVEPEATEKPVTITKRSQKMPQFTKQSKVKPIPLPLRNRSKRRMQPWMWVFVAVVAILGLFLLGNGGSFSYRSMLEKFY